MNEYRRLLQIPCIAHLTNSEVRSAIEECIVETDNSLKIVISRNLSSSGLGTSTDRHVHWANVLNISCVGVWRGLGRGRGTRTTGMATADSGSTGQATVVRCKWGRIVSESSMVHLRPDYRFWTWEEDKSVSCTVMLLWLLRQDLFPSVCQPLCVTSTGTSGQLTVIPSVTLPSHTNFWAASRKWISVGIYVNHIK